MRLFIFLCALMVLPLTAVADNAPKRLNTSVSPLVLPHAQHLGQQLSEYLDADLDDPVPPTILETTYKQTLPPKTLENRIDSLFQSVSGYVPPEFDVYGHAIRLYMGDVLTPSRMNDPLEALEEYKNLRRAQIVLQHWRTDLNARVEALKAEIAEDGAPERLESKLIFAEGRIAQFFTDMEAWLAANESQLEFYLKKAGQYEIVYPVYYFLDFQDRQEFAVLYEARLQALQAVKEYQPFTNMIY